MTTYRGIFWVCAAERRWFRRTFSTVSFIYTVVRNNKLRCGVRCAVTSIRYYRPLADYRGNNEFIRRNKFSLICYTKRIGRSLVTFCRQDARTHISHILLSNKKMSTDSVNENIYFHVDCSLHCYKCCHHHQLD